ncbi:MAG: GC-type dockerin domain-anchored protein [Phycisphaerales bacterium JB060]
MPDLAGAGPALVAAVGLGLAAPAALGQSDPLGEPFPAEFDLSSLRGASTGGGTLGFIYRGSKPRASAGRSIGGAHDWDGDGADELLLSEPNWEAEVLYRVGIGLVLYGRTGADWPVVSTYLGLDTWQVNRAISQQGWTGRNVAGVGDLNADGVEDVCIDRYNGLFEVLYGDPTRPVGYDRLPLAEGRGTRFYPEEATYSVAAAGDVNGDGVDDAIFGGAMGQYEGVGYVVYGRAGSGPPALDGRNLDGTNGFAISCNAYDNCGAGVAGVGDINGDGFDDFATGAPRGATYFDPARRGAVYVVFGRDGAIDPFPASLQFGDTTSVLGMVLHGQGIASAGRDLDAAGDVNGDGIADMVIASPDQEDASSRAFVVFGRADGAFPVEMNLSSLDGTDGFQMRASVGGFAAAVAGLGDVNSDGIDDIAIGGKGYDPDGSMADDNQAFVVFGRADGQFPFMMDLSTLDGTDGFRLDGRSVGGDVGWEVAGPGDVNGDGVNDIAVGAPGYAGGRGAVFVIFGRHPDNCPADLDADGELTIFDFLTFGNLFDLMDPRADFDGDGDFTVFDFLAFQNAFDAGC